VPFVGHQPDLWRRSRVLSCSDIVAGPLELEFGLVAGTEVCARVIKASAKPASAIRRLVLPIRDRVTRGP